MWGKDIVFSFREEDIFFWRPVFHGSLDLTFNSIENWVFVAFPDSPHQDFPVCAHRHERPVCQCAIITFRVFTYRVSLILEFPSTASALFHAKLYRPENICLSSVITPHICSSSICGIETLAGLSITKGEEENTARRNILLCTVFPIRDILA